MTAAFKKYDYMGRDMIDWNIEEFCGYKPVTTYYTDFGIAEWYGKSAIRSTLKRAKAAWKKNIEYMTEIAMVLNWKCHEHHMTGNKGFEELYADLWEETDKYIREHFKGDDLSYYYRTID